MIDYIISENVMLCSSNQEWKSFLKEKLILKCKSYNLYEQNKEYACNTNFSKL